MTLWALLGSAGTVIQIDSVDPAERYHADLVWEPCPAETAVGDVFSGGAFTRPTPPSATLAGRLAALSAERYARQLTGVSFKPAGAGAPSHAASDPVSTGMLTASYTAARDGHWVDGTPWKMVDGSFVPLTAADMQGLALKVLGYVSACFAHEGKLAAALATDLATDITQGWPSNGAAATP